MDKGIVKRFMQVDVFTYKSFKGNPVAVFLDADHLSTEQMQNIARWTNLSESTFVLKPTRKGVDYKIRIFCPTKELLFAGHPTLGTCHALLEHNLISSNKKEIIQECNEDIVKISVTKNEKQDDSILSFCLPSYSIDDIDSKFFKDIEHALGILSVQSLKSPKLLKVGPDWVILQLKEGSDVINLQPDLMEIKELSTRYGWTGIEVFGPNPDGTFEARTFAPAIGVTEDPACGSGAAAVGLYLGSYGEFFEQKTLRQGSKIGVSAFLHIKTENTDEGMKVYVGGHCIKCIEGTYNT